MIFNRVYNLRIMNTDLNIIHEIFRALILKVLSLPEMDRAQAERVDKETDSNIDELERRIR